MISVSFQKAKRMLLQDEGLRRVPYDCGTGKVLMAPVGETTIGIGHNLEAHPLSNEVIDLILKEDLARAETSAAAVLDPEIFESLTENRKLGLINLAFNLGEAGLRSFDRMISAIRLSDWPKVEKELRSSLWAKQIDPRLTDNGRDDRVVSLLAHDTYIY